jgi:hypothetical protein
LFKQWAASCISRGVTEQYAGSLWHFGGSPKSFFMVKTVGLNKKYMTN